MDLIAFIDVHKLRWITWISWSDVWSPKGTYQKPRQLKTLHLLRLFTQIPYVFYYDKTDAKQTHFNSVVSEVWTPPYTLNVMKDAPLSQWCN